MTPSSLSAALRLIASRIEASRRPSRSLVSADVRALLASLQKSAGRGFDGFSESDVTSLTEDLDDGIARAFPKPLADMFLSGERYVNEARRGGDDVLTVSRGVDLSLHDSAPSELIVHAEMFVDWEGSGRSFSYEFIGPDGTSSGDLMKPPGAAKAAAKAFLTAMYGRSPGAKDGLGPLDALLA